MVTGNVTGVTPLNGTRIVAVAITAMALPEAKGARRITALLDITGITVGLLQHIVQTGLGGKGGSNIHLVHHRTGAGNHPFLDTQTAIGGIVVIGAVFTVHGAEHHIQ